MSAGKSESESEKLCSECGLDRWGCVCPPLPQRARSAVEESIPPEYCRICAMPIFDQGFGRDGGFCSIECVREHEWRWATRLCDTKLYRPRSRAPEEP